MAHFEILLTNIYKFVYRFQRAADQLQDDDVMLDCHRGLLSTLICPIQPVTVIPIIVFDFGAQFEIHIKAYKASNKIPPLHHWSESVPLTLKGPKENEIGQRKRIVYFISHPGR